MESISHHKEGETSPPAHYTIKDDAVYTIVVKELVKGEWVAFDGKDMQMEFVRIDPFVRVTMENKAGHMIAKFKVFCQCKDTIGINFLYLGPRHIWGVPVQGELQSGWTVPSLNC